MVFQQQGRGVFKLRVQHPDGRYATLSTGCYTKEDAHDVERVVDLWRGRKGKRYERLDVLDALIEKRVTLVEAYEAHHDGTLDVLLGAHPKLAPIVDLAPELAAFVTAKQKGKGAGQAETYRKQLLVLYPEGELTLANFNRKELWSRLAALEVDAPTRNRYRTAASQFAKHLVMAEILERNFVREIEGYGENDPRVVYYEIDDARRLIGGLAQPYAAIAALALGFCAEWGAIDRGLVGDLSLATDPVTARVRGTKRAWRDRTVPLVPELAWTLDFIRPALEGKLPAAPIIDGVPEWRAIRIQRQTAASLKIVAVGEAEFGPHSLHDWRHTHAVALLRWGYAEQIVAEHEGHKNTTLVRERYGRFKPTRHDYAKERATGVSEDPNSTKSATNRTRNITRGGVR